MDQTDQEFLHRKALKLTPGGAQTFSRMRGHVGTMHYPAFSVRAEGVYLWASDGRRYIDLAGANAAVPLGYSPPVITHAVLEAARSNGGKVPIQHQRKPDDVGFAEFRRGNVDD